MPNYSSVGTEVSTLGRRVASALLISANCPSIFIKPTEYYSICIVISVDLHLHGVYTYVVQWKIRISVEARAGVEFL